jgi:hypothetical protein
MLPDPVAVVRDLLPNLAPHALLKGQHGTESFIIPLDMGPVGIGQDLIHVNKNRHPLFPAKYSKKEGNFKGAGVKTPLFLNRSGPFNMVIHYG